MTPVTLVLVPPEFDAKVRHPGLRAIVEMVGKPPPYPRIAGKKHARLANVTQGQDIPADKFPAYWREVLWVEGVEFEQRCAYNEARVEKIG